MNSDADQLTAIAAELGQDERTMLLRFAERLLKASKAREAA